MNDKIIRDWARESGIPVGQRGRLPSAVMEAYLDAHPDAQWESSEHRPIAICHGCGRGWTGHAQCHCSRCHYHFSVVKHFDHHLAVCGNRRDGHLMSELLGDLGLKPQYGPYGITWVDADERPDLGE